MKNPKLTGAPERASPMSIFTPVAGLNVAVEIDQQRQESVPAEMPYTYSVDNGLASRRSKHVGRTHAQIEAAVTGIPELGEGISMRCAVAGQCENDQFKFQTDRFGKMRS